MSADVSTRERWLVDLREATGQILPGLDYSTEIVSTDRHGLGETLVLTDGTKAVGMSLLWLVSGWEEWGVDRAMVQIMALHPNCTDDGTFRTLVTASETLARAHGKRTLVVAANGRHAWALERLLQEGYRVERAVLRMVLKGREGEVSTDSWVDLSRWAG